MTECHTSSQFRRRLLRSPAAFPVGRPPSFLRHSIARERHHRRLILIVSGPRRASFEPVLPPPSSLSFLCRRCVSRPRDPALFCGGPLLLGEINNVSTQETHCLPSGSIFCGPCPGRQLSVLCAGPSTARPYLSPAASDSVIW